MPASSGARKSGEHHDPLERTGVALPVDLRPESGSIAIVPEPRSPFTEAVERAGGTVAPLSDATRGLVWLGAQGDGLSELLREHPGIGWVQLPWAGVDSFADTLVEFAGRALPVWTSAKSAFSDPVAEHALALTLAIMRGLPDKARSTSWSRSKVGISLYGRSVVIIGAGGIAIELIRLLQAFDTHITIVRRHAVDVMGAQLTVTSQQLLAVLPGADLVVVAAASTDETAHLIGAAELAAMKPTAALVNIARGRLVDSQALAATLHSGHLAGAGLDVTDPEPLPDGHPLWSAPRCIITSHSADTPEMTEPLLAGRVRHNVTAFLGDGAFIGVVDPKQGY